jgi:hypothetical protein
MYSFTFSLTSVVDGVGGQHLGMTPVPIVQEAGWAPGSVWTGAENVTPHRDRPARSELLCRLSYPNNGMQTIKTEICPVCMVLLKVKCCFSSFSS